MDGNVMWEDKNYLEALRRGVGVERLEECRNANYSDFTADGKEPDEGQKEFIDALQITAEDVLRRIRESEKPINAQMCVKMTENEMATWVFLFPPAKGGKEITEDLIMDVLDECNVVYGINRIAINDAIHSKRYLKLFVAAEGTQPIVGVEGSLVDHYPRNQVIAEIEMDNLMNSSMEYRRSESLHPISAGAVICDVVLPVYSDDGMTVTGEILEGKVIPPLNLPVGENVGLNQEKTALISKINGTLIYDQGKFVVKDVLMLFSNVDVSTGNIDTIGSLEIHGDVQGGMSIRATRNIIITGVVGNATVVAGGDIIIEMGARGIHDAVLIAGGNIHSKYIENCTVTAKGHVTAESIINSQVRSDDFVEADIIVGGSIYALHRVKANTIGIKQRRETMVYLGLTQKTLDEKNLLEDRIRELEESRKDIIKQTRLLNSQVKKDEKVREQIYQLENRKTEEKKETETYKERLKHLDEVIHDMTSCELVANLVHPPVKVMMRSDSLLINREENMCRVWGNDGEIRML